MTTGNPRGRPPNGQSPYGKGSDLLAVLHDGASLNQLALMFKMRSETVARDCRDLSPIGMRGGYPVYSIKEAAQRLIKPLNPEAIIRRMKSEDLPPDLQKNFWLGLKAKNEYLIEKGRLFPVEEIVSAFAEAANIIRVDLQLMIDKIGKRTEVTPEQRVVFGELIDGTLSLIHEHLDEAFSVPEPESGELEAGDATEPADDPEYEQESEDEFHGL